MGVRGPMGLRSFSLWSTHAWSTWLRACLAQSGEHVCPPFPTGRARKGMGWALNCSAG